MNKPNIYLLIANEADLQKHKQGIAKRAQTCMTPLGNSQRVPPAGHILDPMVRPYIAFDY